MAGVQEEGTMVRIGPGGRFFYTVSILWNNPVNVV